MAQTIENLILYAQKFPSYIVKQENMLPVYEVIKQNHTTATTLTNANIFVGNSLNVATIVPVSGEATLANTGAITLDNAAVIAKVLTGFVSGAGVVSAADSILSAIEKLDGNIAVISPLTTKGDLYTYDTAPQRLPIGSDAQILMADAAATTGNKWVSWSGDVVIGLTGATTIGANAVTYAKMQSVSATSRLLGSSSTTTPVQEISIGSGLSLSGTTLSSTSLSPTLTSAHIFVGNGSNVATDVALSLSASGGAFSLSNTGILTMPNADGSTRGLLLAADWTTFNSKQSALGDDFAIGDTNGSSENLQVIVNNTNDYMVVGDNTVGSELGIFYYGASSSGASFTETGIIIDVFNNTYSIGNLAFDFILVQQGVVTGLANSLNVTIATPSLFFVLDESTLRFTFQAGGIVNMSLTNYASDAAAGAAGLTTGDLYRTAGAVMVKL